MYGACRVENRTECHFRSTYIDLLQQYTVDVNLHIGFTTFQAWQQVDIAWHVTASDSQYTGWGFVRLVKHDKINVCAQTCDPNSVPHSGSNPFGAALPLYLLLNSFFNDPL